MIACLAIVAPLTDFELMRIFRHQNIIVIFHVFFAEIIIA